MRMFLYVLCIASLCMKSILSCSVHVCLTWEAKKENITFKCKVSQLTLKVHFFNPKNEEEGYCSLPIHVIPHVKCHSSHNVITQDLQTNTTVLVIKRHVDNRLNGAWECSHGTKRDAAIVNVTVLQQETIKTVLKNDNCGEQHMAWTFIGVLIGLLVIFIWWIFPETHKACCGDNWCESWCKCSAKYYYATKLFMCILLMCLTISIAYVSGLLENNCKDKKLFIIYGLCMVFMFGICLSIPKKVQQPKAQKQHAEKSVSLMSDEFKSKQGEASQEKDLIELQNFNDQQKQK